jgi:hypothetical protein
MAFLVTVPNVPGVPPVAFATPGGAALPALLTGDLVSQFSSVFSPQWGIFLGGAPVITAESVTGFEFRNDWTISDYPVEGGTFESYDKVLLPYLAKVRFASGSSAQARANLLNQIAAVAAVTGGQQPVYSVVTPEITYLSASISHYDYRREAQRGVGLVVIDVWLSQVIPQNTGALLASSVQNPASADQQSIGAVAPVPADTGGGSGSPSQITPSLPVQ